MPCPIGKIDCKKYCVGGLIALAVVAADYFSKNWALAALEDGGRTVIDGFLNFSLAFNRGVSFSMLSFAVDYWPQVLGSFAFIVAAILFVWLGKGGVSKWFNVGLGLIIGGAVGNGIDRFTYGAVVDFLDFYYTHFHFPTFNVADTAISIGVGCVLIDSYIEHKQQKGA